MKALTTYIFEQIKENKLSQAEAKKFLQEISEMNKKAKETKNANEPIAIIGMAVRMPEADDLHTFWQNLHSGHDSVRTIPKERQKELERMINEFYGEGLGPIEYNEAAYLERIDLFDPGFFNIPPNEAKVICPEQRLFLEVVWEALEDAGYSEKALYGSKTGIYAGYTNSDYTKMIRGFEPTAITGNLSSVTTARLAYLMNFSGPCPMIDTACSSSLVALHMACQGIRSGDCDTAIVGGVHLLLYPIKAYTSTQLGIESPDGRSRTFDAAANGVGAGEGVVTIVLKNLDKALKDRDHVYAIIKGSAINNDGRSNGITAPNALAQTSVIRDAWEKAGISPEAITYIEAHGTGTRLGDPIEIEGLTGAFRAYTNKTRFCPIGSVKTNIGHLDSAAGLSGLIKTVLAMQHKEIPPSLHFNNPNPFINFADAPVYVNDSLQPWESTAGPRIAGISSFGISGTNSHIVIEEAPNINRDQAALEAKEYLFTITAKTPNSLWSLLDKYQTYFRNQNEAHIADICFTTNIGRGQYSYRLAICCKNLSELERKIELLNSEKANSDWTTLQNVEQIYYGQPNHCNTEQLKEMIVQNGTPLNKVAEMFVNGTNLDWELYYRNIPVQRISLPTYAYDRKRLWIDYRSEAEPSTVFEQITSLGFRPQDVNDTHKNVSNALEEASVTESTTANRFDLTEVEKILCTIWSQVLGYDNLNPDDDFFELGGNSLNAMQIIAKIHKELDIRMPLQQFLDCPTIRIMARELSNMEKEKYTYIPVQPEQEFYPVSSAQKRLFLINQHEGANYSYNMPCIMAITGELNRERFTEVFTKLVARHELFRASFELKDGEIVQRIAKDVPFQVEYAEITEFNIEEEIPRFIRPFDLSKAPLLRVKLLKIHNGDYIFFFDMHHIISDGLSFTILVKEFAQLYARQELPPLRVQYKDFAVWQNEKWQHGVLEHLEEFWLNEFKKPLPTLNLQTDFPRPVVLDHKGSVHSLKTSLQLCEQLREIAIQTGATLYMLLFAAYNILLAKYSNQEDIIIGTPIAGRPHADLENIIGMFVNTLALRNYPSHDKTFVQFVEEVRERTLKAFEHQEYQFEMLIDKLDITPALNRNPLFDTMFVLQNFEKNIDLNMGEISLKPYSYSYVNAKFDITLSSFEKVDGLYFEFEYATALFTDKTISKMADDYVRILEQIVDKPNSLIGEVEIDSGLLILQNTEIDDGDFNF